MTRIVNEFTIGEMSKRTGVNIETIRYYEKIGAMPNPPRTAAGYRVYGADLLKRLTFIRRCRQLGFGMKEIQELLGLVDAHGYTCAEVQALTLEHAAMVRQKVTDLKKLETTLRNIASQCTGKKIPECPIIDALLGDASKAG
jgi:MerR family transcriptional regulator, mercuric resistance operon regulatory protein